MIQIRLEKVLREDKDILFRMLQYSLFEESSGDLNEMNSQALFEYQWFELYFTENTRDAYFIKEESTGKLLGFIMVNTYLQKLDKGHSIAEFMVIPRYRRNGVGKRAAMACFEKYKGSWEVSPAMGSETARQFWKHVIDEYTGEDNEAEDGIFCFTCKAKDLGKYRYDTQIDFDISRITMVRESAVPYGSSLKKYQEKRTLKDYYALPDDRRAELIDGVIYNMSAPSFLHQRLSGEIFFQISTYLKKKKGSCIPMAAPVDVRLDCDDYTMVQPDVLVLCDPEKIRSWGIDGAPDFVLEIISPSTRTKDCIKKLQKYADAGVKEYWILDPEKRLLITYDFQEEALFHVRQLKGTAKPGICKGNFQIDLEELVRIIEKFSGIKDS